MYAVFSLSITETLVPASVLIVKRLAAASIAVTSPITPFAVIPVSAVCDTCVGCAPCPCAFTLPTVRASVASVKIIRSFLIKFPPEQQFARRDGRLSAINFYQRASRELTSLSKTGCAPQRRTARSKKIVGRRVSPHTVQLSLDALLAQLVDNFVSS